MIEIITAAGFALAWAAFRYDRHSRWRAAVDAAHGTLSAVWRGIVEGVDPGDMSAWGQHYLHTITQTRWRRIARATRGTW